MSDYTTRATVDLEINGKNVEAELQKQKQLVRDLQQAYAKAYSANDGKSMKKLSAQLNQANSELRRMQSNSVNVADVLRRLDKATPIELKRTLTTLNKDLRVMQRGSKAWTEQVEKIQAVKKELANVNTALKHQESRWDRLKGFANQWQTAIVTGIALFFRFISQGKELVNAYAEMDQEMANTMKFTGMSREAVAELNEEFKKMDTRTSLEGLNELAQAAGRLGKDSVEDVMGFVRAGDIIGVAMDELGEDAPQIISQLARIFNLESEMGTEKAMLSVGSAINTLSQNCAASAPNLVDFAGRLGAIANNTNMSMDEMLAFGALLDDQKVSIEKSSTAIQAVITKMYADPVKFAETAGMKVKAFTEALKRSSTEGLMMFVESLSKMNQMEQASTLKDLKTSGAGVVQTFQTLAGKVDLLKEQMQTSKSAFAEAASATEEFNVQNNTVQAGLDKAKKKISELKAALGAELLPLMKHITSSSTVILRVMLETIRFCKEHRTEIIYLASTIAACTIVLKGNIIAQSLENAAVKMGIGLKSAYKSIVLATTLVVAKYQKNTLKAAAAQKLLNSSIKVNPYIVFATAILAIGTAFTALISKGKKVIDVQKDLNKVKADARQKIVDEKNQIELLISAAKNEKLSLDERNKAIDKLNGIIPDYNAQLDATTGKYKENTEALNAYLESLTKKYELEGAKDLLAEIGSEKAALVTARAEAEKALEETRKRIADSAIKGRPQTSSGAHAPGSVNEAMGNSAELRALENRISEINRSIVLLEQKRSVILGVYGDDLEKDAVGGTGSGGGNDGRKCPKCGKNPCECYVDEGDDGDDENKKNRFKAEKEWREREIAEARVLYATGVSDYEAYRKRLAEIDVEYYAKLKSNDKATVAERIGFEADYWEALKKQDEEGVKQETAIVERRYKECLAILKKRRAEGLMTEKVYNVAEELLELEYLRRIVLCHEEGSEERLEAEQRYYDELTRVKKERGEKWVQEAVSNAGEYRVGLTGEWQTPGDYYERMAAREAELKQFDKLKGGVKDDVFGLNATERQKAYDTEVKALKDVYQSELSLAGSNAKEKLRIEEAYLNALLVLREKYNPKAVDGDTPKENSYIKAVNDFDKWLKGDGGQAVLGTAELLTSSMSNIFSQMSSIAQAELEIQTAAIERRYDKELSLAEGNTYKIKRLEEEREREIAKAKKEASRKQFAMQVLQTIAQTAIAGLNAYSSTAAIPVVGPALAPAAMALAIATGMLQVAALKKQQQASEAQGYASGGFTPKGGKYEPAGVVHKGEWVASQELLASPVARPMIEALDYAQRTNTIGSLKAQDVSRSITAPAVIASSSSGTAVSDSLTAQAIALAGYTSVIRRLNERLDEPFVTVNTVTGDSGIKKAQDEYEKLMRNKSRKSKYKSA